MWAIQLYEHPILDLFLRNEKISLGGGPGSCYSWICPCAIEMAWPLIKFGYVPAVLAHTRRPNVVKCDEIW